MDIPENFRDTMTPILAVMKEMDEAELGLYFAAVFATLVEKMGYIRARASIIAGMDGLLHPPVEVQ